MYSSGSISALSPDFDSAFSQKGRFMLGVALPSHLEQTLSTSCMMLFFL